MRSRPLTERIPGAMSGFGIAALLDSVILIYDHDWSRLPIWLFLLYQLVTWIGLIGLFRIRRSGRR